MNPLVDTLEQPDSVLVHEAKAGDFAAFQRLAARHERRLYALAWHFTHNHHDAQDVVQNALLSAMEHLDDFQELSTFGTWITRIATNHALKIINARARRVELDAEADEADLRRPDYIACWREDPGMVMDRAELRRVLDDGIASLPENQRLAFVLRDIAGMSTIEAGHALGISQENVKVRLLRARLSLRERLTRRFGDEGTRQYPDQHPHDHSALLARIAACSVDDAEGARS